MRAVRPYISHMPDPAKVVRLHALRDADDTEDFRRMTPAERLGVMWQLALDAWAFTGASDAESRLPRYLVRVHRRAR